MLLLPILLSACGEGTTSASRNLPPDPGAAATATLTGVDTNLNGIRDEVEIKISANTPNDADFNKTMAIARAYQNFLNAPSPTSRAEALSLYSKVNCAATSVGEVFSDNETNFIVNLVFDTQLRKTKADTVEEYLAGGYAGHELPSCN